MSNEFTCEVVYFFYIWTQLWRFMAVFVLVLLSKTLKINFWAVSTPNLPSFSVNIN